MKEKEIDLDFLNKMYKKFKDTSEENIKFHVVSKFLEMMGYDSSEFYFEESKFHRDGRSDISVVVDGLNTLYIEVKNSNKKLTDKDISQLVDYIFGRHLEWGILTNGKNFILINTKINGIPDKKRDGNSDREVFNIDIFNNKDREIIEYFSKECIFDTKITNYFKDIAQYKALKFADGGGSWNVYKGTIINFFKYYAKSQKKYRNLSDIREEEFEEYINYKLSKENSENRGRKINSRKTLELNYSHVRSFFQVLNISNHGFTEERNKQVEKYKSVYKKIESTDMLSDENVEMMLNYIDTRREPVRNKVIFLLSLSFGLERSTILNLRTNSIKNDKLLIENRELVIPPVLKQLLDELLIENKKKKINGINLFYSYRNKKYSPIEVGVINAIFDSFSKIDEQDENWKDLSPTYIRKSLIKQMFYKNYPIEEILYITGADINSISKEISYDDIVTKVNSKKGKYSRSHPFQRFLY